MVMDRIVFVTVGTTQFDQLIESVTSNEVLDILVRKGYQKIILQTGCGKYQVSVSRDDIGVEVYDYKNSIADDIKMASLVISHAGAGSVLETLGLEKPLLVVVNESLMDNHQYELAEKMEEEGHLYYSTCKKLKETLEMKDFACLNKLPSCDKHIFSNYIDKLVGLES